MVVQIEHDSTLTGDLSPAPIEELDGGDHGVRFWVGHC